jgi:hypothetical protein
MEFIRASTAGATLILFGGESGVTADFNLSIVGHSVGDGMTSDGYLLLFIAIFFFMEFDSLIGTSPSDSLPSLPVMSYISSKSLCELRLLHILSSDVSELPGEEESSITGVVFVDMAFGVGKLSLSGEVTPGFDCSFGGGAARLIDTCGSSSIRVLRSITRPARNWVVEAEGGRA